MLISASTCMLYGLKAESTDHLFDFFNQISQVWYDTLRWLGVELVTPRGVLRFLRLFWAWVEKTQWGGC
jgi:hypothetical protein